MIHIISGAPGAGKTAKTVLIAVDALERGITVYSNFPIIYTKPLRFYQKILNFLILLYNCVKKGVRFVVGPSGVKYEWVMLSTIKPKILTSKIWKPELVKENIVNAKIIIDEAYGQYNSRSFKSFSPEEHQFFSSNRHNDLDIYLISQHPQRIDTVIREMTNIFYWVRNLSINKYPILFYIYGYIKEEDFSSLSEDQIYSKEIRLGAWANRAKFNAYDTKQFRRKGELYQGENWTKEKAYQMLNIFSKSKI